eukprot:Pgem_evm1s10997
MQLSFKLSTIFTVFLVSAYGYYVHADAGGSLGGVPAPLAEESVTCNNTWVYCINAYCSEANENGISQCECYIQAPGPSIAPAGNMSGAPSVVGGNVTGDVMCEAMGQGELWSTFGQDFKNTSYNPPISFALCQARTSFAYCWGAKCVADPTNKQKAFCECPVVYSNNNIPQSITLQTQECNNTKNPCETLHNSSPVAITESSILMQLAHIPRMCKYERLAVEYIYILIKPEAMILWCRSLVAKY